MCRRCDKRKRKRHCDKRKHRKDHHQKHCDCRKEHHKSDEVGLHQLAEFPVGNVINTNLMAYAPKTYNKILKKHYNRYTCEYQHKASFVDPALNGDETKTTILRAIADYSNGDCVDFGSEQQDNSDLADRIGGSYTGTIPGCNKYPRRYLKPSKECKPIHVHTLLWASTFVGTSEIPQWVTDWDPAKGQEAFLEKLEEYVVEYIQFLIDLGTPVESIDVCNEMIDAIS
jgi:hypothetical protein